MEEICSCGFKVESVIPRHLPNTQRHGQCVLCSIALDDFEPAKEFEPPVTRFENLSERGGESNQYGGSVPFETPVLERRGDLVDLSIRCSEFRGQDMVDPNAGL